MRKHCQRLPHKHSLSYYLSILPSPQCSTLGLREYAISVSRLEGETTIFASQKEALMLQSMNSLMQTF